ncbi:pyrimidine 5'-nucleotidase [Sphingomonas astaxanthinifaciens DSM 22298]|uniref:Pyrimidine 5'-nucleotidase n=1 Tax=Sphingomonas astaxanthinifaciens DSM 22298 TaxID=1123267 RepID=A0ABQ5Z4M3_9SPHN|nr:pyrimidine 5'-nucleotidase [Sphingomonas astaxanthinifaciens DSM 22298]
MTAWIFDLDNCLYPASTGLFALIDERMGAYIQRLLGVEAAEAKRIQKHHFHTHGTTLAGLMKEHGVDPHDFLEDVHAIPLDRVGANPRLAQGLGRLPGRKFVFTNGDAPYARRVLERIGIHDQFEHLHDIHAAELRPKPEPHGYELLCARMGIDPSRACMVEDMAQNLRPAKALGMTTVWVDNGSERGNHDADPGHIDCRISDVGDWLHDLLGEEA